MSYNYNGWGYSPYYSQPVQQSQQAPSGGQGQHSNYQTSNVNHSGYYASVPPSYNHRPRGTSSIERPNSRPEPQYSASYEHPTQPYQGGAVEQGRTASDSYQRHDNLPRPQVGNSSLGGSPYLPDASEASGFNQPPHYQAYAQNVAGQVQHHVRGADNLEYQQSQNLGARGRNPQSTSNTGLSASQSGTLGQREHTHSPVQYQISSARPNARSPQPNAAGGTHSRTNSEHGNGRLQYDSKQSNIKDLSARTTKDSPSQRNKPNTSRVINYTPASFFKPPSNLPLVEDVRSSQLGKSPGAAAPVPKVEELPTTVDPSHIFDQDEYMRRRTGAEEVNRSRRSGQSPTASISGQSQHGRSDSASREQIEAEMRAMLDKMRDYKAQDPSLFSAVWEQVKKDQPPPRASSQTPQVAKASLIHTAKMQEAAALLSPQLRVIENTSTDAESNDNCHSSETANNTKSLPDLGKFPLARRKRRSDKTKSSDEPERLDTMEPPQNTRTSIPSALSTTISTTLTSLLPGETISNSVPNVSTAPGSSMAPNQPDAGKTVWPKEKREPLAEIAIRALTSDPANAGRTITKEEISNLLEKNPNYDQLCDSFFQRGFQFSKGSFARVLLRAMNSDKNQGEGETQEKKRKRESSSGQSPIPKKVATSRGPIAAVDGPNLVSENSQQIDGQTSSNQVPGLHPGDQAKTGDVENGLAKAKQLALLAAQSGLREHQNQSKEAMARKRTFNDLVDLTALDDSDEDQSFPGPKPSFATAMESNGQSVPTQTTTQAYSAIQHPQSRLANSTSTNRPRNSENMASTPQSFRRTPMALPLDRTKALRRSTYNPATIAKDFLIAKGEHPTERPLNAHLEVLSVNFKEVSYKTDLSTIRWDLIDPGKPAQEYTVFENGSTGEDPGSHDDTHKATGEDGTEAKDRYSSTAFADFPSAGLHGARGPLSSRGRGRPRGRPRGRGSMQPVTPRKLTSASRNEEVTNSDTSSQKRSSGAASGALAANRGAAAQITTPADPDSQNNSVENKSDVNMPTFLAVDSSVFHKPPHIQEQGYPEARPDLDSGNSSDDGPSQIQPSSTARIQPVVQVNNIRNGSSAPSVKRRGRPPKYPRPSDRPTPTSTPTSQDAPRKRGRPPGSKNSPFARKPGRPSKEHPPKVNTTVPEDGIGVMIASRSPSSTPASVSYIEDQPAVHPKPKRWKAYRTYPSETSHSDAFISFKCHWIGCKAELHNLETLQKHIFKVHQDKCYNEETATYSCFWNPCGQLDAFKTVEQWESHIEEAHLDKLAQQLGDGPTVHPTELGDSYLFDAQGNRITPTVRSTGVPDPLPLYAGRGPTRSYHKAHGNLTPEARARAEAASLRFHAIRAAEAHKEGGQVNKTAEWRDEDNSSDRSSGEDDEDEESNTSMED